MKYQTTKPEIQKEKTQKPTRLAKAWPLSEFMRMIKNKNHRLVRD
jgi:hypothetical protein